MSEGGGIVVGLALVVVAGILNGSWNASFSPSLGLAVGKSTSTTNENENENENVTLPSTMPSTPTPTPPSPPPQDLQYHLAWVLFQTYAAVINVPICLYWAGGLERVNYIVSESSATSIGLICFFSILWGVGSVGFGLACQIAGVGLGTNLTMGVIMILGTFLPLCLQGAIGTLAGGVVIAGLAICCIGLVFAVWSLQTRDADELRLQLELEFAILKNKRTSTYHNNKHTTNLNNNKSTVELQVDEDDEEENMRQGAATNKLHPPHHHHQQQQQQQQQQQDLCSCLSPPEIAGSLKKTGTSSVNEDNKETRTAENDEESSNPTIPTTTTTTTTSSLHKVAVCVIAGIFAAQLQFAFVFGEELLELAESEKGPGTTPPSGTSAVIWLFAISLGAPVSIVYGLYSNPSHIPWNTMWKCRPCWYRHILLILTTSLPWVAHIHLYGYANTYLPQDLAASVAWPILMMTTVVAGMLWSIGLGEWTRASALARKQLYIGLGIVALGVGTIMASMVAVP